MDDRVERMLLQHEIEQFYHEEAVMLDERRFFDHTVLQSRNLSNFF